MASFRLNVYIRVDQLRELEKLSQKLGKSFSELTRDAIDLFIEEVGSSGERH